MILGSSWLTLGMFSAALAGPEVPKNGSGYELAFREGFGPSWPRFWGGQGSIFGGFWMIFGSFLAYFGHVFGCSCWGGYAPPDPPALDLVFVVLG